MSFIVMIALGVGPHIMAALPVWFGLITPLMPEEVMHVRIPGATELELGENRQYFVFTQRRVIIEKYNLHLESVATGLPVELREEPHEIFYDTDAITGLMLYHFTIEQPGIYQLQADQVRTAETLLIAPDYTGRNQNVLFVFYAIWLLPIGFGAWWFWQRGQKVDETQVQSKRSRWDAWVEKDDNE